MSASVDAERTEMAAEARMMRAKKRITECGNPGGRPKVTSCEIGRSTRWSTIP